MINKSILSNLLFFVAFLFSINLYAQLGQKTTNTQGLLSSTEIEKLRSLELPALNNKELLTDELNRRLNEPTATAPKFAIPREVNINPNTHGTWFTDEYGQHTWAYIIKSATAYSLNFGFTEFSLPQGAEFYIYNINKTDVLGPFTVADNEQHNQLWTPIVYGDEIVLQIKMPSTNKSNLGFQLTYVNHDFVGFGGVSSISGSCNLDVICSAADGWAIVDDYRDIIQSVAVLSQNGSTFCTGFLINNTGNDCRPYFMTANHCGVGAGNAPSLVTYWNFVNSTCRQPGSASSGGSGDGQLNDFNTGSTFRASYSTSDMTLVELDDPVTETANAFFAGWNWGSAMPTSSIGVHHPSTDEKRISFDDEPAILSGYFGPGNDHVQVLEWNTGTTEGGSSGSPLFDQNKRVVGQLHGGSASCFSDTEDLYGWIGVSWEGGGTPSNRLKDWLDPLNIGVQQFDGKWNSSCLLLGTNISSQTICELDTAYFIVQIGDGFTGSVQLSLSPSISGATFSQQNIIAGGTSLLSIPFSSLSIGVNNIVVTGDDGTNVGQVDLSVYLENPVLNDIILNSPNAGEINVSVIPDLSWTANLSASQYQLQISNSSVFNNLILDTLLSNTSISLSLNPTTTYYWRVKGLNDCGESDNWSTRSFTTNQTQCLTLNPTDLPLNIPATPAGNFESIIEFLDLGTVVDINVLSIQGNHTYLGDLEFRLVSPSGTEVLLLGSYCGNLDGNIDISFDDMASGTPFCPFNDGNTYPAQQLLSAFNNEPVSGDWTLKVTDLVNSDGGSITNWELQVCYVPEPDGIESIQSLNYTVYPNPANDMVYINGLTSGNKGSVYSITGQKVLSIDVNGNAGKFSTKHLPNGTYLIEIISLNGVKAYQKIVVHH